MSEPMRPEESFVRLIGRHFVALLYTLTDPQRQHNQEYASGFIKPAGPPDHLP